MQRLEIAADGHRLGNGGAIVEDQNRHALDGIERGELRRLGCTRHDIDLLEGNLDALFGKEYPDPAGVRRSLFIQYFHCLGRRLSRTIIHCPLQLLTGKA